jgi:D-galactarolactone cycloisomerase
MTADVRITAIDIFRVEVPVDQERLAKRVRNCFTAARVDTSAGVTGWSFAEPPVELLDTEVRPALVGHDLFDLEGMIRRGLMRWRGVEHAVWDAIGKLAGQPVHRLLGGTATELKTYLTCVWPGNPDQSGATFDDQAAFAVQLRDAGFRGMKLRAWRPDPMDDVKACGAIRDAAGPDLAIMVDRTADFCGDVWDFDTALAVARGLEQHGVTWLEEPFARDDYESPARLADAVDIAITGGESYLGLEPFRQCLEHRSFDIMQPDVMFSGGIHTMRKVAAMCEAWGTPCIPHGNGSLALAAYLQIAAALDVEWQEIVYVVPPLLPDELWEPATALLETDYVYRFHDGMISVPTGPGLGLPVDEDAMQRYRVDHFAGSGLQVELGKGQART